MRPLFLAVVAAGALLAGCSKPEPAAGAPSPTAVTVDSTAKTDSTATAALPDSAMNDSTMAPMKDTAAVVPDTAKKN
jgi:nitrous oxide reductase accessory protein NosL